jgi:hypothetical protein
MRKILLIFFIFSFFNHGIIPKEKTFAYFNEIWGFGIETMHPKLTYTLKDEKEYGLELILLNEKSGVIVGKINISPWGYSSCPYSSGLPFVSRNGYKARSSDLNGKKIRLVFFYHYDATYRNKYKGIHCSVIILSKYQKWYEENFFIDWANTVPGNFEDVDR